MKNIPITKKQLEEQPLYPMKEQYSYTRFKDQRIVPNTIPRIKKEYVPGEGYVNKMRRK